MKLSRASLVILASVAALSCAFSTDGADSITPAEDKHFHEHGEISARLHKTVELLMTGASDEDEPSLTEQLNKDIGQLLKDAEKIEDEDGRASTIAGLKMLRLESPMQSQVLQRDIEIDAADKLEWEAKKVKEEAALKVGPADKAKFEARWQNAANGDLIQLPVPEDPEEAQAHLELREFHDQLYKMGKEGGVDMTAHRTRSPEEHNDAIAGFFAQIHELGPDGKWHEHLKRSEPELVEEGLAEGVGKKTAFSRAVAAHMKDNGGSYAAKCLQGIMTTSPPNFCWKPSFHNHEVPTKCAPGWKRHMAECFRGCKSTHYWVGGGTCWAHCDPGYHDHGATCYKGIFNWYGKNHYWADRRTNFHKESRCNHPDQYKSGAMCYKKCSDYSELKKGLTNCGYDACSSTGAGCGSAILNMIMEIGFTLANVVTMGTASMVKSATTMASKLGKSAMRVIKNTVLAIARAGFGEFVKQGLKNGLKRIASVSVKDLGEKMLKQLGEIALENAAGTAVKLMCNEIAKGMYSKMSNKKSSFDPKSLDPTGIAAAADACKDPSDPDHGIKCAGGVIGALGTFDPTGLLGVAAAFMHPKCRPPSPPGPPIARKPKKMELTQKFEL